LKSKTNPIVSEVGTVDAEKACGEDEILMLMITRMMIGMEIKVSASWRQR